MSTTETTHDPPLPQTERTPGPWLARHGPGLGLTVVLAALAYGIGLVETALLPFVIIEPLLLALIAGMVIRALWLPPDRIAAGIGFAAKELLEVAIVVLGLTLNLRAVQDAGVKLLLAILLCVSVALVGGTVLGRLAGLPPKQALLIAVGNAICGNSAIAAAAPVINAKRSEVASAIALTAVLGVVVVIALPLLVPLIGLTFLQYGVVAGLTVYAVPQVVAATISVSVTSSQIASLVKLTRVLCLGPVVTILAFLYRSGRTGATRPSIGQFVPWFVLGFLLLAILRTTGVVSDGTVSRAGHLSTGLTVVAMAGLGLSVDLAAVRRSGLRIGLVVLALLGALVALATVLVLLLGF